MKVLKLTAPDGADVYVVKAMIESWHKSGSSMTPGQATKINLTSGAFQFVRETLVQVSNMYESE